MNSVSLIGRLTRNPETRVTSSQMAICKFSIAVDRITKDKGSDFPNIVAFGKTAENCGKFLHKGNLVGITGRIQTGSYERDDGSKVYTTDVVADRVEFLEHKEEAETPRFEAVEEQIPF